MTYRIPYSEFEGKQGLTYQRYLGLIKAHEATEVAQCDHTHDEQWQRKLIKRWMEFETIDHHSPNANDLLVLCNMVAKHEREECAKLAITNAFAIRGRGTK